MVAALAALSWLVNSPLAIAQAPYSKVVIFGDSLSDTGNLAGAFGALPPPYYRNRISNGPVAVDRFTQRLSTQATPSLHLSGAHSGFNYAVAGGAIIGNEPEDLAAQISAYLARPNHAPDPSALYLVMIGGNDLRSIRGETLSSAANSRINSTASRLAAQLQRLINQGAKQFLVANVPNIGRLPETLALAPSRPGIVARAQAYTLTFNQVLSAQLKPLQQQPGVEIIYFDLYSAFENLIRNAASRGYTQTTVGCFNVNSFSFHPDCLFGTRFERFVFFDNIHPTSKAHTELGESLYQALPDELPKKNTSPVIAPIIMLLLD